MDDDLRVKQTFLDRIKVVDNIIEKNGWLEYVWPVPKILATSEKDVYRYQNLVVSEGYEGAIVRAPDGLYELGFRSRDLLKVKSFQDSEFEIIGHTVGVGRFSKCVIWKCKTEDGKYFSVVPKGTIEQKEEWASTAKDYYGKMLTVKYFCRSEDGIPVFPVGLCVREDGM
jgi:DNA ligase-1